MDGQAADDGIELLVVKGEMLSLAQDKADVAYPATVPDHPGLGEHPWGDIYAHNFEGVRSQGEAYHPRPARDVEHAIRRPYLGEPGDLVEHLTLRSRELAPKPLFRLTVEFFLDEFLSPVHSR